MTVLSDEYFTAPLRARVAYHIEQHAQRHGLTPYVYRLEVRRHLKAVLSGAGFWVRMHTNRLAALLSDGALPSYVDNVHGQAHPGWGVRAVTDLVMFQAKPEDRLVFGYLSERPQHVIDLLSLYGPVAVKLRCDARVSFAAALPEYFFPLDARTGADECGAASLVDDPSELSWAWPAGCPLDVLKPGELHAVPVVFEGHLRYRVTPADIQAAHFFNPRAGFQFIDQLSALGIPLSKGGGNAYEHDW